MEFIPFQFCSIFSQIIQRSPSYSLIRCSLPSHPEHQKHEEQPISRSLILHEMFFRRQHDSCLFAMRLTPAWWISASNIQTTSKDPTFACPGFPTTGTEYNSIPDEANIYADIKTLSGIPQISLRGVIASISQITPRAALFTSSHSINLHSLRVQAALQLMKWKCSELKR